MPRHMRDFVGLIGFVGLCLTVAAAGGAVTQTSVHDWYQTLAKPAFTPPDWLFAPVWTTLYVLMAVAAWRVWRKADGGLGSRPLAMFGLQLGLNLIWSFIFFGARSIGWALVEIVLLWIAVAVTTRSFRHADRIAGGLFVPYLLWVTYAMVLNASLAMMN